MTEQRIAWSEFRAALGECLERVQWDGEAFIILRYGQPVAKLVPLRYQSNPESNVQHPGSGTQAV